jgi:hypothetical protein
MPARLMRGFKALAERTALGIRRELGIGPAEPLDCLALADHLGVRVLPLTDLVAFGARKSSVSHLLAPEAGFSALTVCKDDRRLIVYNPAHPPGRQSNSLAHELAHMVLEHQPESNPFQDGCRVWDDRQEAEADWLAAALLVPRDGALRWLASGKGGAAVAEHFGVSLALVNWRVNQTGAAYQLQARQRKVRTG